MPRIRTVKPDFWEDETVGLLSPCARLLFIATWNLADDEGVLRWTVPYLRAAVFMYDDYAPDAIAAFMGELEGHGLVVAYEGGEHPQALGYVRNFARHQRINRPQPGKHSPPPSNALTSTNTSFSERSVNGHGAISEPSPPEGKGNRREGKGREIEVSPIRSSDLTMTRPEIEALCNHLADRVEENGSKRPTITHRWREATRLLLDNDGRTVNQVHDAINWCQADEFWRTNVLSMPTLRQQYDRLRLAAQRTNGTSTTNRRVIDGIKLIQQFAEMDGLQLPRGSE